MPLIASGYSLSSHASKLVQVFWQAHCLRTIKYSNDCNTLFGEILPFSGPHGNIDESSSLSTKPALLFQFEQYFLKDNVLALLRQLAVAYPTMLAPPPRMISQDDPSATLWCKS
jgi:hypothetical protein